MLLMLLMFLKNNFRGWRGNWWFKTFWGDWWWALRY